MQRINLWYSTSFQKISWIGSAQKSISNKVLTVTSTSGGGYVGAEFDNLQPNTEYVFSIDVKTPNDNIYAVQIYASDWSWLANTPTTNGRAECRFTTKSDAGAIINLFGVTNDTSLSRTFTQPNLELASTYDAAVAAGGPSFFDWETMPLNGVN